MWILLGKDGCKMLTFDYKVCVPVGIHVRNALLLSQKASQYKSNITLCKEGHKVNAKKLMDIMVLRVRCGDRIRFIIEGPDEKIADQKIREFCEKNL